MDQLRPIFPDLDDATLQATLDAHDASVERSVDYLLSTHSSSSPAAPHNASRSAQEASDEALARRLQEEDYNGPSSSDPSSLRNPRAPPSSSQSAGEAFALPSLADVQSAVRPLVDGVVQAGRVAADSVSGLYRDLVGDPGSSAARRQSSFPSSAHRDDDSVVLRAGGEDTSSPSSASRGTARQRRPDSSMLSAAHNDKKDD